MKNQQIALRTINGLFLTAELGAGDDGRLNARGTEITAWNKFRVYCLDGKFDVGARILLEALDGRFVTVAAPPSPAGRPGRKGPVVGQPSPVVVVRGEPTVFTVARGGNPITWALTVGDGQPITIEDLDSPNEHVVQLRADGQHEISAWQSVSVIDVATGTDLSAPF